MTAKPQPAVHRPAKAILELGESFYDPVEAAPFPETRLRFRNNRAAAEIGLEELDEASWIKHFGRFTPLPGTLSEPLALRYHGHQFRVYNPEIGDGRGFLFSQLYDADGRLLDLGTKGSGRTPWSRFGDGRLTLKGGVREVLATEMLEALGVSTSRSLSLIETGEALDRVDEPSPTRSAVLVRLNHSHIRIGSFQRLAYFRDEAGLTRLTDYVLKHYFGEAGGQDAPARLLDHVVRRTARMAGQLMAAGFVHGVLNSDNINVTGECFDYGPWRFVPIWDPAFTAAYFDQNGLYSFGRQPEAIYWDVMQLAVSLAQIADDQALLPVMERFGEHYQHAVTEAILWRIGVLPKDPTRDQATIQAIERALRSSQIPIDRFFFECFGGAIPENYGATFDDARAALNGYASRKSRTHPFWQGLPCSMLIDEVELIWADIAANDDWSAFEAKIAQIREFGAAIAN